MGNACTCETSEPDAKLLETLAAQAVQARTNAELREEIAKLSEELAEQVGAETEAPSLIPAFAKVSAPTEAGLPPEAAAVPEPTQHAAMSQTQSESEPELKQPGPEPDAPAQLYSKFDGGFEGAPCATPTLPCVLLDSPAAPVVVVVV
jgi:hypothetical protein